MYLAAIGSLVAGRVWIDWESDVATRPVVLSVRTEDAILCFQR